VRAYLARKVLVHSVDVTRDVPDPPKTKGEKHKRHPSVQEWMDEKTGLFYEESQEDTEPTPLTPEEMEEMQQQQQRLQSKPLVPFAEPRRNSTWSWNS